MEIPLIVRAHLLHVISLVIFATGAKYNSSFPFPSLHACVALTNSHILLLFFIIYVCSSQDLSPVIHTLRLSEVYWCIFIFISINLMCRDRHGGIDGIFLCEKFPADMIGRRGRLAINITVDKIHHRGISSSIRYMYFPSSMSSQGQ